MFLEETKFVDDFWNTDLAQIERTFLSEGESIVDLPTHLNDAVPAQGSVLLEQAINVNTDS